MSINDMLGYISTFISFFSAVFSLFGGESKLTSITLILFASLSFAFMLTYIRRKQNKENTIQILSMDNRMFSVRTLLLYESLKSKGDFQCSNLRVSHATYEYDFKEAEPGSNIFHMECKYTFRIKHCKAPKNFDLLILQPGKNRMQKISYSVNGQYPKTITTQDVVRKKTNFTVPNLLKAPILFESNVPVNELTISYTLPRSDRIDSRHMPTSIIMCPFIYAKKIKNFEIIIKFHGAKYRPSSMILKKYPYNGKQYRLETESLFQNYNDRREWAMPFRKCTTQAIYVIEMHDPSAD